MLAKSCSNQIKGFSLAVARDRRLFETNILRVSPVNRATSPPIPLLLFIL